MESGLTLGQFISKETSLDPYQQRVCSKCLKIGGSGLSITCLVQSSTTWSSPPVSLRPPFTTRHSVAEVIQWLQSSGQGILWGWRPWPSPLSEAAVLPLTVMGLCLVRAKWHCVPARVNHSAHDDTVYTLTITFTERFCSTGVLSVRSRQCQEESGPGTGRVRYAPCLFPMGLISEEELLVLLLIDY